MTVIEPGPFFILVFSFQKSNVMKPGLLFLMEISPQNKSVINQGPFLMWTPLFKPIWHPFKTKVRQIRVPFLIDFPFCISFLKSNVIKQGLPH